MDKDKKIILEVLNEFGGVEGDSGIRLRENRHSPGFYTVYTTRWVCADQLKKALDARIDELEYLPGVQAVKSFS